MTHQKSNIQVYQVQWKVILCLTNKIKTVESIVIGLTSLMKFTMNFHLLKCVIFDMSKP